MTARICAILTAVVVLFGAFGAPASWAVFLAVLTHPIFALTVYPLLFFVIAVELIERKRRGR